MDNDKILKSVSGLYVPHTVENFLACQNPYSLDVFTPNGGVNFLDTQSVSTPSK